MRLGGENYENFKAKVVSYTTIKTEQPREGRKEMHVPMELDHVSGCEPQEDREDVVDVRRGSTGYNFGMMRRIVEGKARAKGEAETEARDAPKVKARR